MPIHRRLALPAVLVLAIVIGLVGVLVWTSPGTTRGPAQPATLDRAAIERVLAERAVQPSGRAVRFELAVAETAWELLPGVTTAAVTFNGTVPGPEIRVMEGDALEVVVRNDLSEPTSIHWHGLHVPNDQDGVAGVTQDPITPGQTYTYRFIAPHAGTFMYHAHGPNSREQIDRGLYAPFIIEPASGDPIRPDLDVTLTIGNWMIGGASGEMPGMDMTDDASMSMEYDYFTINGKSYPATEPIAVAQGELVRLRFLNPSQTIHPMHLHGMDMAIVAKDGEPLVEPQRINTLDLGQGETYDVAFLADSPGTWVLHCHDLHHASNAGVEPGGLIVPIVVRPSGSAGEPDGQSVPPGDAPSASTPTMASDMSPMPGMESMPGMGH